MNGLLILVSAPSGAGKTSLVAAALQADDKLVVSVSHTTREQRPSEEDGVNYHFVTKDTFADMIADGAFLEHACVFDNQYGTGAKEVQSLREQGKDVVLEIDWQGADQIMAQYPDTLSIFVLPPDQQTLRARLIGRGQDSQAVIERRLSEARLEMSQAPKYQYIVVNDEFTTACDDLLAIIRATRLKTNRQLDQGSGIEAILSGT